MINKRAHTLTELLMASAIIVILLTSLLGAFLLTKLVCRNSIASYNIQRDVDTLLATIIRGVKEQSGNRFGLRSAVSIPPIPGLLPIPGQNTISYLCTDNNTRMFLLNNNTVIYDSPLQNPRQTVIYTAPANSNIILRFASASADQQLAYVYVSVSQQLGNKTITGSAETNVNLRNMPR